MHPPIKQSLQQLLSSHCMPSSVVHTGNNKARGSIWDNQLTHTQEFQNNLNRLNFEEYQQGEEGSTFLQGTGGLGRRRRPGGSVSGLSSQGKGRYRCQPVQRLGQYRRFDEENRGYMCA